MFKMWRDFYIGRELMNIGATVTICFGEYSNQIYGGIIHKGSRWYTRTIALNAEMIVLKLIAERIVRTLDDEGREVIQNNDFPC